MIHFHSSTRPTNSAAQEGTQREPKTERDSMIQLSSVPQLYTLEVMRDPLEEHRTYWVLLTQAYLLEHTSHWAPFPAEVPQTSNTVVLTSELSTQTSSELEQTVPVGHNTISPIVAPSKDVCVCLFQYSSILQISLNLLMQF